jgi:subtilisin family serine protease
MAVTLAWADAFQRDRLTAVQALPLTTPITREWAFGDATGVGVTVAVVDSGIEVGHPAVGEIDGGVALVADNNEPAGIRYVTGPHDDVVGHGTACAGVIRSLAPDCRLLSVRVLGEKATGRGPVFAAGVRWAVEAGAKVVNLSLSSSRPEFRAMLYDVTNDAYFADVVVVCALNNLPQPSFPSTFASVISVAAHAGSDRERYDANPHPPADFGAPGIDVSLAWRGGQRMTMTGNSFAAPHITGHVARLLSRHPTLTPYEVKTVLRALADNARPA